MKRGRPRGVCMAWNVAGESVILASVSSASSSSLLSQLLPAVVGDRYGSCRSVGGGLERVRGGRVGVVILERVL